MSTLLRFPSLATTCIPRRRLLLSRHFTTTRLVNASHRDLRSSGSSWRRPPRPDWLDSLDSKLIFYAIITVNAGVYLTWELAMQTHVRHTHSPRARLTSRHTAHDRRRHPVAVHARQLSRRHAQRHLGSHVREFNFALLSSHQRAVRQMDSPHVLLLPHGSHACAVQRPDLLFHGPVCHASPR